MLLTLLDNYHSQLCYRKLLYILKLFFELLFTKYALVCLLYQNFLSIYIVNNQILKLLSFLKNHTLLQFNALIDCAIIDRFENFFRFQCNYFFNSITFNSKLIVLTNLIEYDTLHTLTHIYSNTLWLEREI